MLNHAAGSGQHTYKARGKDCYETPPQAVHALLKVEKLPYHIWEPACGSGNIAKALIAAGHDCLASDLYDYGYRPSLWDINFLNCDPPSHLPQSMFDHECIVTNPPYKLAQRFVEIALKNSPLVIMLLRLAFLESQRRTNILEHSGLARVHVFRKRLPMMHRKGWTGKKASSAIPFAWFVWERGYTGPITVDRISA